MRAKGLGLCAAAIALVAATVGAGAPASAGEASAETRVSCEAMSPWDWNLHQPAGDGTPVVCDLNLGDAGLFSIDVDDLLERAAPFGVDEDDVMWIQAWGTDGDGPGGYSQTTTTASDLGAERLSYWVGYLGGVFTPSEALVVGANGDHGDGDQTVLISHIPREGAPVQNLRDGAASARASTAIDQTAPRVDPVPKPAEAGTGGAVRITFNPGASTLYPVDVGVEPGKELEISIYDGQELVGVIGGRDGSGVPRPPAGTVSAGGYDAPLTLLSSGEPLGDGMQLVPTQLGNPDAQLAWYGVPGSELGPTVVLLDVAG